MPSPLREGPPPSAPEIEFCLELGTSLQAYGTPAHRFEETLTAVASQLGVEAQFFALPTGFMAWMRKGGAQETYFLRSDQGATDLAKLQHLQDITDLVATGGLSLGEASERLREALRAPRLFGVFETTLCAGVASGAFAVIFDSGWREALGATLLGAFLGLLGSLSGGRPKLERVVPAVGAMIVALLAAVLVRALPGTAGSVVTLAALVVLLPGLPLLIAMNELATGNLVAGTSRLMSTVMIFLQLAAGVALGQRMAASWLHAADLPVAQPLPHWALAVALLAAPACFLVLFQSRPRELPWICFACWLAYAGARYGTVFLGPEFGAGVGAYLLGVGANLYGRFLSRPSIIPLLPGLIMLVPGSVGYRSLTLLTRGETLTGIDTAVQMLLVAVSLLVGLLLSRVTVEPRRPL